MNDLELLRTYEPVVRFTRGELFFPCAVDEYVRRCSLLERSGRAAKPPLVEVGQLDLAVLAAAGERYADRSLCLRFVQEPLTGRAFQRWLRRADRPEFHAPGRLARVGLAARSVEAMFTLSLLLRGTVPGGTAAAAQQQYQQMQRALPGYVYHGRVVRQGGYICLQYLFFYAMNDWRSTFSGVNDHEADWEQIFVYLEVPNGEVPNEEAPDEDAQQSVREDRPDSSPADTAECCASAPIPAWVAYASHDFSGDDLRRRWDDPELQRIGTHPVVFAGAGSHASYFTAGEYLTSVEIRPLRRLVTLVNACRRIWQDTLRQGDPDADEKQIEDLFSIPFVDYARGDGLSIGPGQQVEWTPVVLAPARGWSSPPSQAHAEEADTPRSELVADWPSRAHAEETATPSPDRVAGWAHAEEAEASISDLVAGWSERYRGLWGLDTRDPLSGELAPSGPRFNRDGSIRRSWYDPLGWAGLGKVAPPSSAAATLAAHIDELQQERDETEIRIDELLVALPRLDLEVRALQSRRALASLYKARAVTLAEQERELNALQARHTELEETLTASSAYLARIEAGDTGDPRAHIHRSHDPAPRHELRRQRLADLWAAVSIGVLLLGVVAVIELDLVNLVVGLLLVFGAVMFIESLLRGRLERLLLNLTIVLALISAAVLIYRFYWPLLILAVAAIALVVLTDNIRELRRR